MKMKCLKHAHHELLSHTVTGLKQLSTCKYEIQQLQSLHLIAYRSVCMPTQCAGWYCWVWLMLITPNSSDMVNILRAPVRNCSVSSALPRTCTRFPAWLPWASSYCRWWLYILNLHIRSYITILFSITIVMLPCILTNDLVLQILGMAKNL